MDRIRLRETITNTLKTSIDLTSQEYIINELVEAVMRLSLLEKMPVDWKLMHGEQVEQSDLDRAAWETNTLVEFERAMGFNALPWGSSSKWNRLERCILARKREDTESIQKFAKASRAEYSTFKPPKIYQDPDLAIAVWPLAVTPPPAAIDDSARIIQEVSRGI